ncbi:MAG TPA: ABC transporter ATP-binding protein, partial [Nitriliruptorales bacterium]|nr:ABC transporter ATP-binding protein [Nitriliruptorales bacterium]
VASTVAVLGSRIRSAGRHHRRRVLLRRTAPVAYQTVVLLAVAGGLVVLDLIDQARLASVGAVIVVILRALTAAQPMHHARGVVEEIRPYLDRIETARRRYRASAVRTDGRTLQALPQLRFDKVSFHYTPGRAVLDQISFQVAAGEAVAIVGPSGSGKSTLVQLLLRLRTPQSGQILIGEEDVSTFSLRDWSRLVAYVPQEPRVLDGSVARNIRFFRRGISDLQVRRAARLAHLEDEIAGWPAGYGTRMGPRGVRLSGGQRQRLCLARALAGEPSVLVLDEPTSALDPVSEDRIRRALEQLKGRVTLVVVGHRPAIVGLCDRVMELRGGRLVGEVVRSPAAVPPLVHGRAGRSAKSDPI